MTYGEHRFLQPPELMLDAWKRLFHYTSHKSIFRPDWVVTLTGNEENNLPHGVGCKTKTWNNATSDEEWKKPMGLSWDVTLIHYYQKSIAEWIVKLEQSMEPYIRLFHESYDTARSFEKEPFVYDAVYVELARKTMAELGSLPDGGIQLAPNPEFRSKFSDYPLYAFFKLRVALGDEWDEDAFLADRAEIREAVKNGTYADGLQYFIEEGFKRNEESCWIRGDEGLRHCI